MRPTDFLIVCMVALGFALVVHGVKAAEHPAMTSDHGPGWRVYECRPGEACRWRGRVFDNSTGCQVDLWSVANAAPKGTKTTCPKVDANHRVNER